jgi:DHA1 family bicyclomycin/chloramphenicol resistance-like MFS transporter
LPEKTFLFFSASLIAFLMGMGLINPFGTAIALQPFGRHAGAASALLGFLQMGCAALAINIAAALPFPVYTSLTIILVSNLSS